MIEEDYGFDCPYCGVELSTRIDATGGRKQRYVQDCETCCKPIQIVIELSGEEVIRFSAEQEE